MYLKNYKSGIYKKQDDFECFIPEKINHKWMWDDPELNVLLEKATKVLGELNAFSEIVPDVDLFIQMHITKEALTSSKIEGTQTEMDEILMDKEDIAPEKRDDWDEVHNYISAINYSIKELNNIPLSNRLIRKTHEILLESVRGEKKSPGEFRRSQNWIGGTNPSNAVFIPPPNNLVPDLMSDLELFLHNKKISIPHLIKIAICHYQFETIHPFLDGNGRIGRLLITLYLVSEKLLIKPSLYLSDFFEKRRTQYYDSLTNVRIKNDLTSWIKLFLQAVTETAENSKNTLKKILDLSKRMESFIVTLNRKAENGKKLLNLLYRKPFIETKHVSEELNVTTRTANELIKDFQENNILTEITGKRRNRIFIFKEYVETF